MTDLRKSKQYRVLFKYGGTQYSTELLVTVTDYELNEILGQASQDNPGFVWLRDHAGNRLVVNLNQIIWYSVTEINDA